MAFRYSLWSQTEVKEIFYLWKDEVSHEPCKLEKNFFSDFDPSTNEYTVQPGQENGRFGGPGPDMGFGDPFANSTPQFETVQQGIGMEPQHQAALNAYRADQFGGAEVGGDGY